MTCRLRWIVSLTALLAVAVGAWSTEISEMEFGELLMEKDANYAPEVGRRPHQPQAQRQQREVRFQLPEIRRGRPVNSGPAVRRSPRNHSQPMPHQQSFRRGRSAPQQQQVQSRSRRHELRQHRQYVEEAPPQSRRAHRSSPQASGRREQEQQLARERQMRRAERYAQQYVEEDEVDHDEYEPEYEDQYDMYQGYEEEYEEEYEAPVPVRSRLIRVQNHTAQPRARQPQQQRQQRQRRQDLNDYAQQEPRGRRAHREPPVDDREARRAHRTSPVDDREARRARRAQRYAEPELEEEEEAYQPRQRRHHRQQPPQQEEYYEVDHGYMGGDYMPEPAQDRRFRRLKQPAQQGPTIRNEQQILEEAMRLLQQGGMGEQQQDGGASQVLEEYNPAMDNKGQNLGGYLEVSEEGPAERKRPHHRDGAAQAEPEHRRRRPEEPGFSPAGPSRPKIERGAGRPQERPRTRRPEPIEEEVYDESVGNDGIFVPFPTWMDYFNDVDDLSSGDRIFHCPSGPVRPVSDAKDIFSTLTPANAENPGAVEAIAKRNPAARR